MSQPPKPPTFTHHVARSPLLDRLQAFLPQLKAANDQLEDDINKNGADKYSFEDTSGCENPIRLQLSIGVLEPQKADEKLTEEDATKKEMNPHNLAILPSELDEKKKNDQQPTDLVMPWKLTQPQQENTQPPQQQQSMVTVIDDDQDDDDDDEDNDDEMTDDLQNRRKKRRKNNTQSTQHTHQDTNLEPLLGSINPSPDLQLDQDTMKLGSHLFSNDDEIMTAAEAVSVLRSLGYEAVSDVSHATPYHNVDDIPHDYDMNDDCETLKTKTPLVEEVIE